MNFDKDWCKWVSIKNWKIFYSERFYEHYLTEKRIQETTHKRLFVILWNKTIKREYIYHRSEDEVLEIITPIKKYLETLLISKPKGQW